jgi:hypothetical protein
MLRIRLERRIFRETFDVILKAWRQEEFSHKGKFYQIENFAIGSGFSPLEYKTFGMCHPDPYDAGLRRDPGAPDMSYESDSGNRAVN